MMDISMNAGAASVEKTYKKTIMSTCHGLFSLGGGLGAAFGSSLIGLQLPNHIHLPAVSMAMILCICLLAPVLLKVKDTELPGRGICLAT